MKDTEIFYMLTCPSCGREHPLLLYPYEGVLVCGCGATIGDITITFDTAFKWVPKGSKLNQKRYENIHFLDDKVLSALSQNPEP